MNFQSKFQKSKGELKKIEEENAHLKNRIAKGREAVMNICEDIEALQVSFLVFSLKNNNF